ncbi:hypothetical protein [Thermosulfurimonas sp. F29]|uniref:hypothetical protein n=1 Tax=Thermosulfurimonas sp. F29 TaxID=2867247 RepID=UPI001C834355|nr:hypothetical protein [Thermosulfurimonas sp. F29]MBX6421980.1 hypothetical protein [Thermosulfurimonas sp. F29]
MEGYVLAEARGLFGVNQAAGGQVIQANIATLSINSLGTRVRGPVLSQAVAFPSRSISRLYRGISLDVMSSGVLAGAKGVFQINQSAGSANVISNVFSFSLLGAGALSK